MRKFIPSTLAVLGFLTLFFIDWHQNDRWRFEKTSELNSALQLCKIHLENSISNRFNALESLASLFVLHPDTTLEEFSIFASSLIEFHPPIRALQYADSMTRVTFVYPPKGNKITIDKPMTLLSDPKRGPFTKKAIREKRAVLQGPFELRQKGMGIVLRFPIFKETRFLGLSIGVYDLDDLIKETLQGLNLDRFAFKIEDKKGNVFWRSGEFSENSKHRIISIADKKWMISGAWNKEESRPLFPRMLIWLFGSGFILSSMFLIHFFWKQKQNLEIVVEKRTQDLFKVEEKYRLAMEATSDGIWDWDLKTETVYYSQSWSDILLEETVPPIYESWASKIHPEDKPDVLSSLQEHLKGKTTHWQCEHRLRTKIGEWKWVLGRGRVVEKTAEGKPLRMVGTMTDISEQKKAGESLRQSEEQLKKILQTSPNAVIVYDIQETPQFINQSFTKIFGWTLDEIQDKNIPFVPDDEKDITASKIKAIYSTDKPLQFLSKRFTKFNEVLDVNINAAVYKNTDGENIGLVVNLTDITEQLKTEEQLRQAQKMESVGRLAGGVAHDFNNMLSIILGNSEILMEDLGLNHPSFSNVKEVQKAAERSANLTRQLLAFARKQTISPKIIDLNATIEGTMKMLERLIGEDIDLSWCPKTSLWHVKIDPSQIDQMLANLCVNARDSIKDVGKVTIETDNVQFDEDYCKTHPGFKPGNYVMIGISDNGCGMDKEIIENLFEPFFTTKKVGEGTGLGLATVYGIIKQNNGFINVYSESGEGSTFKLYIPSHEEHLIDEPAIAKEISQKGSETILLVEDEKSILQMTKSILERLGYTVLVADTPDEALRISHKTKAEIHLLVTDVVMPSMNGRELAEKILKFLPNIKCLYISGYTENVIAHRGILDKEFNFINKPFSKQDLSVKIRKILDEKNN